MAGSEFSVQVGSGWVFPENVEPLVSALSLWNHYDFDGSDWIAIDQGYGYERTDAESDIWFSYPLMGEPPLEIQLAKEPMADPVFFRVLAMDLLPESLAIQIETTVRIFGAFDVRLLGSR